MAQRVTEDCDRTLAEANRDRDGILEEARVQTKARREAVLKATQTEKEILDDRWRLKAETEAAKAALSLQNEAVIDVLQRVRHEIDEIVKGPRFPAILDALLVEVMAVAPDNVIVLVPEAHLDHVRQWLSKNGNGSLEVDGSAAYWDGVAVQDASKTFRISNTMTGRFVRVEGAARKLSTGALFEGNSATVSTAGGGA